MAGGGAAQQPSGKKKARIEIIPLIDVVFFLLATFVLFTLSLNKIVSVPVDLPKAGPPPPGPVDVNKLPAVIQVTDAGIYWDKELITERELAPRLQEFKRSRQDPKVLLAGDDRAKFGPTVMVLDEVRKAGISQVNIETAYRATGR
jgi:biopolymer transport protein ExbD